MEEMVDWVKTKGISPVVTETVSTLQEDQELKRVSRTHREGRAFDLRSAGWSKELIEEFQTHFNEKYSKIGAISASSGKRVLIVHHNSGTGYHFHVQLDATFRMVW